MFDATAIYEPRPRMPMRAVSNRGRFSGVVRFTTAMLHSPKLRGSGPGEWPASSLRQGARRAWQGGGIVTQS
jgi:hypothetical protein